jgi:hypothetical protein
LIGGLALPSLAGASAAKPSLQSLLLTIQQFPVGWAVDNSNSSTSGTDSLGCLTLSKVFNASENKVVTKAFAQGNYPQLQENLVAAKSPKGLMTKLESVLTKCPTFRGTVSGENITGTVGALSFPKLGSQSLAYPATITVKGVTLDDDFVIVRQGPYVVQTQLLDFSPDVNTLIKYSNLALAKLS